jgi:predicted NBD/HSP70 family sugar kinase
MALAIGVRAAGERVAVGVVEGNRVVGEIRRYPDEEGTSDSLAETPAEAYGDLLRREIADASAGAEIGVIGIGTPGIIRDGVIEESPNLQQLKGMNLRALLASAFPSSSILILNDADALAAGIAATRGQLGEVVRVWTLGTGLGFGRYPQLEGVWEAGHCVVTLDPKERFCGCGGAGHLEGILGHRAMRLRFMDMEPEEIFQYATEGDERCRNFANLWHRALAAATASSIHLNGPGKFYISGPNAKFVETGLLHVYLSEMVKMSPLQGSYFEVIPTPDEISIVGAAVNASAATRSHESAR